MWNLAMQGSGKVYVCVYIHCTDLKEIFPSEKNLTCWNRLGSHVTWLVERMNWLLARYISSQKMSGFSMLSSFAILRSPRRWLSIAIPVIAWKIFFALWKCISFFSVRTSMWLVLCARWLPGLSWWGRPHQVTTSGLEVYKTTKWCLYSSVYA